jgi:hypothetical protein
MDNKVINVKMVAQVARALQELRLQMVFIGGAVISLYTDDPAADEIRPTGDIDMTIKLAGYGNWVKLQERLIELGFSPNPEGHAICSYLYNKILIDIMPAEDSFLGVSNKWYIPGFNHIEEITVEGQVVRVFSAPYYLATKFEAFHDRGGDYRTSHDFEDIIYVIDNRVNIVNEIQESDNQVRNFLIKEFSKVLNSPYAEEYIRSQIHPLMVDDRFPMVMDKIKQIVK